MGISVKQKLVAALSSLSLVILVVGVSAILMLDKLASQNEIYNSLAEADKLLYQARLSQADYMLLEEVRFREAANQYLSAANQTLNKAKVEMAFLESIKQVEEIQNNIELFRRAFKVFSDAKIQDINGRAKFDANAKAVSLKIDAVLLSIDTFFNQNQQDFEEFNRYIAAKEFKDRFNDLRVAVWRFNTKSTPERVVDIDNRLVELKVVIPKLQEIMLSPETQTLLLDLIKVVGDYESLKTSVLSANRTLKQATNNMLSAAGQGSEIAQKLIKQERELANNVRSQTSTTILIAILIATILSVSLAIWLIRSIMSPLNQSVRFAQDISKGNLTSSIHVSGDDEFSVLNRALNESANVLQKTISEIKAVFNNIAAGNKFIEEAVNDANTSMQSQLHENDMLATALNETSMATDEIAQNANNAAEESNKAENATKIGNEIVAHSSKAMQDLSSEMGIAEQYVDKLNTDVSNITSILSVIGGIANQTNLLALNAAIEAARAGEQGRGFAVVADEVRTLAQKTQDSIEEITKIIELLQDGASNVVNVMSSSTVKTQEVLELTEKASEAYVNIASAINIISELNNQVSGGSKQQSTATLEINGNISKINALADLNGENLQSIKLQVTEQTEQLQKIGSLIQFFKV